MKRQMLKILMALCLALCLAPAALAEPTTVVKIDVGGADKSTDDYEIKGDSIILRKRDTVIYELTGTTDKKISIWGSNDPADIAQAFYIRANNVTINGGIQVENSPVKMVLDVPEGTNNTISKVTANDLTIKGSGTLRAQSMSVNYKTSYMPSALSIRDTNVIVTRPSTAGDSDYWNGPCVLSGTATVKYIGNGKYAPLKIGQSATEKTHSLTLKDSAKLYCLQDDPKSPSPNSVSGLEIFGNAPLLLQDNSYLEAEGKAGAGEFIGRGIESYGDIQVTGNAEIKATAQDTAIAASGSVTISGGKVTANSTGSTGSNGIYSDGKIEISNGAEVEATGYWPALYGSSGVEISSSRVDASALGDVAIFSPDNVSVRDSVVKTKTLDGSDGIFSWSKTSISGSWIETSGNESYDGSIQNSVLFNGDAGKVIGDAQLPADAEIAKGRTLLISAGTSLNIGRGKTLVNNGLVTVEGSFSKAGGTLICNSHSGGAADCKSAAACSLCGTHYGAPNAGNHTGLKHVEAKAATNSEDGNIEYWYCSTCGRYYSDAQAAHEIAKEETVIEKLAKVSDQEIKNLPRTGDDSRVMLWLALLAVSGGLLAQILVSRKKNVKP